MYVCVVGGKFFSTVQMFVLDYFASSFSFFFIHFRFKLKSYILSHF